MSKDEKLEWIYKGANSLVDREEYLLGRKVDKPLEQLNEEEKAKKFVLPAAKNHVEHECIPPSIRDFNKIVLAEQVDLSAKLQEDPLVAIKKREEEARRQFLQNPVQLKKLQDALKKKESQKNKHKKSKKKHSEDDLDEQIKAKLKQFKSNSLGIGTSKKESKKDKADVLNTILMHKFNALKDKLSEDDLNDILNGKISDTSDEEKSKKKKKNVASSDSDSEAEKIRSKKKNDNSNNNYRRRRRSRSRDFNNKRSKSSNKRDISHSSSEEDYKKNKNHSGKRDYKSRDKRNVSSSDEEYGEKKQQKCVKKYKRKSRSRSRSKETRKSDRTYSRERRSNDLDRRRKDKEPNKQKSSRTYKNSSSEEDNIDKRKQVKSKGSSSDEISNSELDKKIMAQLKLLRGESEAENKKTARHTNPPRQQIHSNSSDSSDSEQPKKAKVQYPEKPKHLAPDEKQSRRNIKKRNSSSSSDSSEREAIKYRFSDSEDEKPRMKSFGLVSSDGKKIALNKTEKHKTNYAPLKKIEEPIRPERKHVKRMTEEEKEALRKEMMSNAKVRDKEREKNVKLYREKDKREEEIVSKEYDADLVHTELLKSAKNSSVEDRIRSKLNTIQRSSRHMDQNFSKRH